METEELKAGEFDQERIRDIILVVGGAALIFYLGHNFGFSAGRKAGMELGAELGTLAAKASMLDAVIGIR